VSRTVVKLDPHRLHTSSVETSVRRTDRALPPACFRFAIAA